MDIKILTDFSIDDFLKIGDFGYTSTHKYEVKKDESLQSCTMQLNLMELNEPFVKQETNSDDDLNHYMKIIKMNYSLGVYIEDKLLAIAIVEPQTWNNTLLIWHFQVHNNYKRRGYGKLLIDKVIDLATQNKCRAVTLETQNTNVPAIHFYKSCGFTIEGIDLSLYDIEDITCEEVALYMRKKMKCD